MKKSLEGLLVDSVKGIERAQVLFDDTSGVVLEVGNLGIPQDEVDFYYDDDCLVFAGMIDVHVHAREDVSQKQCYKEDYCSCSLAALNGGVVGFADMPNNPMAPIDEQSYLGKWELTKKSDLNILLYAGIGPTTFPLRKKVPYKAYMGPSVGDLYFKTNAELEEKLRDYRREVVSFHCEDPQILEACKREADHYHRRPLEAEVMATSFALELIERYELKGKLCHFSAASSLPLINEYRKRGVSVQTEATPQHLYFCLEDIREEEHFGHWQMNPPIRSQQEQHSLLEGLRRGDIDFLATDHAPHTLEEKEKGISGLTGLDTYGPFCTWLIHAQGVDPKMIAKIACENPGAFFGPFRPNLPGLGKIVPDFEASFTILNLKRPILIKNEHVKTKVGHTPFDGITFPGSLEAVFLKGKRQ